MKEKVNDKVRIICCTSNSAAICNVYGLLDDNQSSSKTTTTSTTASMTVPLLMKPCNTRMKHIITVDWGNNSLNFNYLQRIHNQDDNTMEAFYTHSLSLKSNNNNKNQNKNQLKTMTNYGDEILRKLLTN